MAEEDQVAEEEEAEEEEVAEIKAELSTWAKRQNSIVMMTTIVSSASFRASNLPKWKNIY